MTTDQENTEALDLIRAEAHVQLLEVREAAKALLDLVTPRDFDARTSPENLDVMTARLRLRAAIARSEG